MNSKTLLHLILPPFIVLSIHVIFHQMYAIWPDFDIVTHTLGGIAIAYSATIFTRHFKVSAPTWLFYLLILGLVMGTATAWEFAEWLHDAYFHVINTPYAAQLGITDTMGDYLCALIGAAVTTPFFIDKKRKNS